MKKLHTIGETGTELLDQLNDQIVGMYNILDYGAVSGGADAQVNIQAAIDDAVETYGATVLIPAGIWNITGAVVLKSWVSVEIQNGATFIFQSGYTGSMWIAPTTNLNNCKVNGGNYVGVTPTWNLIDLISTGVEQHVVFCSFGNMYAKNVNKLINLTTTNDGWINGNSFKDIITDSPIVGLEINEGVTSQGIDGNYFSNIQYQCCASSLFGIHFDGGASNHVNNFVIWDISLLGETASTCTLTSRALHNYIIGVAVKDKNFVDDGTLNTIISN